MGHPEPFDSCASVMRPGVDCTSSEDSGMASKQSIESFLSCRRIAVFGVSRDPRDFSRSVFRAFVERGYDAVPVNPHGGEAEGRPCARTRRSAPPPPCRRRPPATPGLTRSGRADGHGIFWPLKTFQCLGIAAPVAPAAVDGGGTRAAEVAVPTTPPRSR